MILLLRRVVDVGDVIARSLEVTGCCCCCGCGWEDYCFTAIKVPFAV